MQEKEFLKSSQTAIKASYVGAFRETPLRGLSVLASSASIGQLIGMTIREGRSRLPDIFISISD